MTIFNRKFNVTLLLLLLIEELSFLGYLLPAVNSIFFWLIIPSALALAVWRLEWAILLVLLELLIGSKGYLFFDNIFDVRISIRIALWSVVMLVWLVKTLVPLIREKNSIAELKNFFLSFKTGERRNFALLALFVLWGLFNGLLIARNSTTDTLLDFNGWLFFLLIFPLTSVLRKREDLENILPILAAGAFWLAVKTFFLAFVFSHFPMDSGAFRVYRWIRTSGVGEITQIKGGFFRIFFQSQIFSLISLFIFSALLFHQLIREKFSKLLGNKKFWLTYFAVSFFLAVILISMSRSFWLGATAGFIFFLPFIYRTIKSTGQNFYKKFILILIIFFTASISSIILIVGTATFPLPRPIAGFNTRSLLDSRLNNNEAAIISRWVLLPSLWQKILQAPIFGSGFGTNLTYQSSDPRQLLSPNHGEYTTYTFEWGWLDIWLKLGLIGVVIYLILIYQLVKNTLKNYNNNFYHNILFYALSCALIGITVIHFFSPYLNHPLGIGFIIFLYAINQINFRSPEK